MKHTKKNIIKEMLTSDEPTSYDLIALKADCEVSYVKSVEKEMRRKESEPLPVQGEGFTPGEWVAKQSRGNNAYEWKVVVINQKTICEMEAVDLEDIKTVKANARLIAAAPDMYDFLKKVSSYLNYASTVYKSPEAAQFYEDSESILSRINQSK